MADRQKLLFFLSVPLAVLLIYLLWMQVRSPRTVLSTGGALTASGVAQNPVPTPETSSPVSTEKSLEEPEFKLPGRDPFQWPETFIRSLREPPGGSAPDSPVPAEGIPPMTVQGIFWGITPSRAIINNQILTEGDTIEGAQVIRISKEGVTLDYHGTETVLKVPQPSTRDNQRIHP